MSSGKIRLVKRIETKDYGGKNRFDKDSHHQVTARIYLGKYEDPKTPLDRGCKILTRFYDRIAVYLKLAQMNERRQ
ncbi:hypothetical protein CEXT_755551 [Caerostris extrusa]|uniref:Uncharacterized protein n=1 Tax=Caerostris extrusa TaxID=172846 RepID=A0AAV4PJI2_CAEEX|nr:hypothetical protein CEXT_755551 [Caerostris extrusa]